MADALIIQNSEIEGPGNLGRILADDGFDVHTVDAKSGPIPARPHDLLVVLGGPQSANDPLAYLDAERDLILQYARMRRPVLGICLGAQLAARALGARVGRGPLTEVGFYDDLHPGTGPLFSGFADPFLAFHWHGDTFDLPDGAVRLASSAAYPNQAFCAGTVVGIQFHLEVDIRMANRWIDCVRPADLGGKSRQELRGRARADIGRIESNMRVFYRNFKSEFGL